MNEVKVNHVSQSPREFGAQHPDQPILPASWLGDRPEGHCWPLCFVLLSRLKSRSLGVAGGIVLVTLTASALFTQGRPVSAQTLETPPSSEEPSIHTGTQGWLEAQGQPNPTSVDVPPPVNVPPVNVPTVDVVPVPSVPAQPTTDSPVPRSGDPTNPASVPVPSTDGPSGNSEESTPPSLPTSEGTESTPPPGTPTSEEIEGTGETEDSGEVTPQSTDTAPPSRSPQAPASEQPPSGDPAPASTPREGSPDSPPPGLPTPSDQPAPPPGAEQPDPEQQVVVSEVVVQGAPPELQELVYGAIQTFPGRTTTRSQLQTDLNAVYGLGYFATVRAFPEDTPLGVRVTFVVEPNPVLQGVRVEGNQILTQAVVDEIFKPQYGKTINFRSVQQGIEQLTKWYQDRGYVLAQTLDAPQVTADGIITLVAAEGIVEGVQVRYLTEEGEPIDDEGKPVEGKTRPFIITREMALKPGDVFNRNAVQEDLRRVFGLGIFEDVRLSLNPGQDPRKVIVSVDVIEGRSGSIAFGAGISSSSGLFGSLSFQQRNLGGNAQTLGTEIQVGQRELLFDLNFTDPWIATFDRRTSYTVEAFRRRSISLIFDGGDPEIEVNVDEDGDGDRPRVNRTGAGISFSRPLAKDPLARSEWSASTGFRYQRVEITDSDGDTTPRDELGNLLSFTENGTDDLFTLQFGVAQDRRNNALRPTNGSVLRLGLEQSLPIGDGSILFSRLRGSYSYYIPTRLLKLNKGCRKQKPTADECPQTFAFNVQAGTIVGDLPPYEAFSLGGSNSIRGFDEGDVGSGRSFLQATAEYRFPLLSIISGALFVDVGTDLGTGDNVPGDPAGVRGKAGSGVGGGLGLRVQSPLGPIRVDFAINDNGDSRVHFGVGEKF